MRDLDDVQREPQTAGTQLDALANLGAPPESFATDELDSGALQLRSIEVTLVGAGRSGAMIALIQSMLGVKLRLYDPDRLGPENQGLQLHRKADITARRFKVNALRSLVRTVVPTARIAVHRDAYVGEPGQARSPIVVMAVDTMAVRRQVWERLRDTESLMLLLDVRLGRGVVRLHEVVPAVPEDVQVYEKSLHDDAAAVAGDCRDEATTHASAAAAALIGGAIRAFVEGTPRPRWIALDLDRAQWTSSPARSTVEAVV